MRGRTARVGAVGVVLISLLALAVVLALGRFLEPWERAAYDMRVRWRYLIDDGAEAKSRERATLVAVDETTERRLGRFGAGQWVPRTPFYDQLRFFLRHFTPSVLVYDVVFLDTIGSDETGDGRVSESPERLREMADAIEALAKDPTAVAAAPTLWDLNRFSSEQGRIRLIHALEDWLGSDRAPPIIGYYFRGGSLDDKPYSVDAWSDADIFGKSPAGAEEQGERIPYLCDVAIPADDVRFASADAARHYVYAPNATTPFRGMLDVSNLGFLNGRPEADGVVRRLPLVGGFRYYNRITRKSTVVWVPSLALASCLRHVGLTFPLSPGDVQVVLGHEIVIHAKRRTVSAAGPAAERTVVRIPIDEQGRMWLNFRNRQADIRHISFASVALPPGLPDSVREATAALYRPHVDGRVVVVGVPLTGSDQGSCSLEPRVSLVHMHMTAIENILNGDFIRPLSRLESALGWVILFVVVTGICLWERSPRLGATALLLVGLCVIVSYVTLHASWRIVPLVLPVAYAGLTSFGVLSYRFFTEERAKRRIRDMFSTMVSGRVLSYLEEHPESFALAGQTVDATILFSDIRDFTAMSERLAPEQVTNLLNRYLTPVTDVVMAAGGFLDKYIGDAMMAVWGAPYPDADHARKACEVALAHQDLVASMQAAIRRDFGVDLEVRIGVNSGRVTAGNMGSEHRFQYTVIGDAVNLAARLEPANKDFGTRIIVGARTRELAGDGFVFRTLGFLTVKGKTVPEPIHELVCRAGDADALLQRVVADYEAGLARFHARDWAAARRMFEGILAVREDGPARFMLDLARRCQAEPPGPDWHGEFVRLQK